MKKIINETQETIPVNILPDYGIIAGKSCYGISFMTKKNYKSNYSALLLLDDSGRRTRNNFTGNGTETERSLMELLSDYGDHEFYHFDTPHDFFVWAAKETKDNK